MFTSLIHFNTFEYVSNIPIVPHDPHACFLILFLWFRLRLRVGPSVALSTARLTFSDKFVNVYLYRFNLAFVHE